MGSYPLDRPKILKILDKAGPALLQKLCIEPVFMAYLVQADILSHEDSQSISSKEGQVYQREALLSHLRQASVEKFIDFCFVLVKNAMKQEVVTEDFGLKIEDLKKQKEGSRKRAASPTSYCEYGIEIDIELRVKRMRGDHPAYEKFKRTMQDTLRHNRTGTCEGLEDLEDDINDLIKALLKKGRKAMSVNSGSVVFRIYCPNLESLQELQSLCTSGQLAHLAENIFRNHPDFAEFGLDEVDVEVTIDEEMFGCCEKVLMDQDSHENAPHSLDESETVILSVVGHYSHDPDGIYLLDNLLTEQIKQLIPNATILHVVLEDQQKILADGQQASFVGYNKTNVHSSTPSSDWLNYNTKDCYTHLIKHRVSHIIAHAPEFILGAINIKVDFFPEAKMIMMINEQIDMRWDVHPNMQPGRELVKWASFAEGLVALGRQTYDDVESMLSATGCPFDHNRIMSYLPSPPLQISQQEPWSKPPDTIDPVILIHAGCIEAQEQQKMVLPMVVHAITSVAEDLFKSGTVRRIAVKIAGIPEHERNQLKDDLEPRQNLYTSLEFVEESSFSELIEEMKECHMCILPLGCTTQSYGLEFMISAGFGVPTLIPDSVGFTYDAQEIVAADDHSYLREMVVQVMAAKSQQEEEEAWMDKIRNTMLNIQQVEKNTNTLRLVIQNSHVLRKSQQDFVNLLQAPPRKRLEWQVHSADSWCPYVELDHEKLSYIEQRKATSPSNISFPEHARQQYDQYHRPDLDCQVTRPNNKKTRFLKEWLFMIGYIQPLPVVDVMLAQGSINYVFQKEVHDIAKTHGQYAAMRGLLNLVRRKGETGIDQLGRALRDPSVDCGFLVERFEGIS